MNANATPDWSERIYQVFPFLAQVEPEVREAFFCHARPVHVAAGQTICFQGQQCEHLAMLLEGRVRVFKVGEQGREVTMYRARGGDSCILSAACILSEQAFPAQAVAETEVRAVAVPSSVFKAWADDYPVWRHHVFGQLVRRMVDVIEVLEEVTFRRLDARLATYLLAAADEKTRLVSKTHQAIAADLGTSREVISRLLKELEREQLLRLARGKIALGDQPRLQQIAAGRVAV